jgi:hypothetical protein
LTPVYAIVLVVGVLLLLLWVASVAVAEMVEGWSHVDPDRKYGRRGRIVVGGLTGFGMGGMSATFAGWPAVAALGAAIGGVLIIGAAALYLVDDRIGGEA